MNVRVPGRRRRIGGCDRPPPCDHPTACDRAGLGAGSPRDIHDRSRRRRPLANLDDRLLEPERREQAVGVEPLRERDGRALEFRGEVPGVHGVDADSVSWVGRSSGVAGPRREAERVADRTVVPGRRQRRHVGGDDAERSLLARPRLARRLPRRVGDGDVERDDLAAAVGERASDARAPPDADLDQPVVSVEGGEERPFRRRWWCHGAAFMTAAGKNNFMLVDIVPVGKVTPQVKREASSALRSVYDCDVTVHDDQAIPDAAFDADRDQYRAEDLIETVTRVGGGEKNIGITPEDLYYRRRNYVFGLAYLNGSGSVISTHRLRTSSDGGVSTKPAVDVFGDRVRKEVVHEIGHTLGLEHCDNSKCVMSFSPTVREVDVKEENLCGTCSRLVR